MYLPRVVLPSTAAQRAIAFIVNRPRPSSALEYPATIIGGREATANSLVISAWATHDDGRPIPSIVWRLNIAAFGDSVMLKAAGWPRRKHHEDMAGSKLQLHVTGNSQRRARLVLISLGARLSPVPEVQYGHIGPPGGPLVKDRRDRGRGSPVATRTWPGPGQGQLNGSGIAPRAIGEGLYRR